MNEVIVIDKKSTYEWLEKKHYAHLVPAVITNSFGLFVDNLLSGVCTYSPPPRMYNNGENLFHNGMNIKTLELSRLCINDNLPKNTLSQFVAGTFRLFQDRPLVLISYADSNVGHNGYIYQATNWIYTGLTNSWALFVDENGNRVHERVLNHRYGSSSQEICDENNIQKEIQDGKHRYFQFIGSKTQLKSMKREFKLEIAPYPKGDNKRYDSSYNVGVSLPIDQFFEF